MDPNSRLVALKRLRGRVRAKRGAQARSAGQYEDHPVPGSDPESPDCRWQRVPWEEVIEREIAELCEAHGLERPEALPVAPRARQERSAPTRVAAEGSEAVESDLGPQTLMPLGITKAEIAEALAKLVGDAGASGVVRDGQDVFAEISGRQVRLRVSFPR
jgi:hypothetical protein|tara:strand:- start:2956 stop:3435 length:480 start_codon:yes stop_codon:yes gene_type:complete